MVPEAVKHYVQYHNTDAQGGRPAGGDGRFQIYSSKSLRSLPGHTVWLVSGEGPSPKRYFLEYIFVVEDITSGSPNVAWGTNGQRFDPPLPLNGEPWFADFKRSQQNFSLGVREIGAEYLAHLEAMRDRVANAQPQTPAQILDSLLSSDYLQALRTVQNRITEKQVEMLVGLANAPGTCLSMARIAACGGYDGYEAANSQFGRLGALLARAMGVQDALANADKTMTLATEGSDRDELGHWQWQMRPALREALCQLWPDHVLPNVAEPVLTDEGDLRPTERAALVQARIGQGRYRKEVLALWHGRCALTGLDIETALVASHALPWKDCSSNAERLDPYNGLLLSASVDRLFDAGLIAFDDDGRMLVDDTISERHLHLLGLTRGARLNGLHSRHIPYLREHRKLVFGS